MLCPSCNAPNREDAKFCKGCGQALRIERAAAPEQVITSAPDVPAQAPASEEKGQQVTTPPPSESELAVGQQVSAHEDPALAPTLILSPEKVLAYHSRFWAQGEEEARRAAQPDGSGSAGEEERSSHPADQPTLMMLCPLLARLGESPTRRR